MDKPLDDLQRSAAATLCESMRPGMRRLLSRRGIPEDEAEDLIQDSFLQYFRKRSSVRDAGPWLLGALRKECLMYWRRRSLRQSIAIDQAILESIADPHAESSETLDLRQDLERAIAQLRPACRSLLKLRYRLGYERVEIVGHLGYAVSSFDKIAQRCLADLCKRLIEAGFPTVHDQPPLA